MDVKVDPQQLLSQTMSQTPKKAAGRDSRKLKETAQQFEAIYIQQVFKEMRKTIPKGGLIERGNADDIYTQLQDAEAGKVMASKAE
ncbi:rod-binding protein [Malonomonas rubra]|uniref:rod-binding protein n=1 Tax=Malonomonas rubra TaxID=57040 RepID=UPI0026EEC37E|nr:rod-binding protein [Malonomonas rubra]